MGGGCLDQGWGRGCGLPGRDRQQVPWERAAEARSRWSQGSWGELVPHGQRSRVRPSWALLLERHLGKSLSPQKLLRVLPRATPVSSKAELASPSCPPAPGGCALPSSGSEENIHSGARAAGPGGSGRGMMLGTECRERHGEMRQLGIRRRDPGGRARIRGPRSPLLNGFQSRRARRPQRRPCGETQVSSCRDYRQTGNGPGLPPTQGHAA